MALSIERPLQNSIDLLAKAFAWWIGELRGCVPRSLQVKLTPPRPMLSLIFAEDWVQFELDEDGQNSVLGKLPFASNVQGLSAEQLPSSLGIRRRFGEIRAILPAQATLRRRIELPAAAASTLEEAVGFEIDRLTPFRSSDVVFRVERVAATAGPSALSCDLIMAPRARIQAALNWAAAHSIQLDRVYVETGTKPEFLADIPLRSVGGAVSPRHARLPLLLLATTAIVAAGAFSFHVDRQQAILDAYLSKIAETRKAAASAIAARERIAALRTALGEAMAHRHALPLIADVLAELTTRLPDDSWLTELRLADGHVALIGYSSSAAALVPVVEASPMFQDTRLSAPVTSDSRLNRERFSIDAAVTPRSSK